MKFCSIIGYIKKHYGLGYCQSHYHQTSTRKAIYKKWRETDYRRLYAKKYRNSVKGKISNKKANIKYYDKLLGKLESIFNMSPSQIKHALKAWGDYIKTTGKCAICDITHVPFDAHHILYRNKFPEMSLDKNNGVCLCIPCHSTFHDLNGWRYEN